MKLFSSLIAALSLALLAACGTPKLQPGGAYAPTNSVGQVVVAADPGFYFVDSAYDIAHSVVRTVLQFEYDNRAMLFSLAPDFKHSLDRVRPDIVVAERSYDAARQQYLANPTAAGLTALQTALAKMQQLAQALQAAQAALPQKGN